VKSPAVTWSSAPFSSEKTASAGSSLGLGGGQCAFEWLVVDVLAEGGQVTVSYMNGHLCARFRVCNDMVGCSSTFGLVAAIYAAGPYEIR
jgi:hypothetical protein